MTEPEKDTQRAIAAAKLIIDGRNPTDSSVMVTLEGLVSLLLLAHDIREMTNGARRIELCSGIASSARGPQNVGSHPGEVGSAVLAHPIFI